MSDPRGEVNLVLRYYETVADLGSSEEDLAALLAPDVKIVEHPNLLTPRGASRDLEETLAGFKSGKALLSEQNIEILSTICEGEKVVVRSTWRGTIGIDALPFRKGQELVAHAVGVLRVRDGKITHHETFDCYEPF